MDARSRSFFLRAEAALRWPEFGDAQSFYEAGVKTAMEETGVSIGEYLSSTNTITGYSDPCQATTTPSQPTD